MKTAWALSSALIKLLREEIQLELMAKREMGSGFGSRVNHIDGECGMSVRGRFGREDIWQGSLEIWSY